MKTQIVFGTLTLALLAAGPAWSQGYSSQWGTGQYMAAPACPYAMEVPQAVKDIDNDISDEQSQIDDLKKQDADQKKKLKQYDAVLSANFTDKNTLAAVKTQLLSGGACADPTGNADKTKWGQICPSGKYIDANVQCAQPLTDTYVTNCKELFAYSNSAYGYGTVSKQVTFMDAQIKAMTAEIGDKNKDRQDAMDKYQTDVREGKTEAECETCKKLAQQKNGPGIGSTILAAGIDAGNILTNYFTQRSAIKTSADLGYAYYPYPSMVSMYPMATASLYGSVYGGIGSGSVGCAPTISGGGNPMGPNGMASPFGMYNPYGGSGGPFGYPQSMFGGQGGNMFTPGMGPWGMNGMNGGPTGGMYGIGGGTMIGGGFGFMTGGGFGAPMGGGFGAPMGGGFGAPMGGGFGAPMGGGFGAPMGGGFGAPMGGGFGAPMGGGFGAPMGGGFGAPMGGGFGAPMGGGFGMPMGGGFGMPMGGFGAPMGGGFGMPMGGGFGMPMGGFGAPMGGGMMLGGAYGNQMMMQQMQMYQQYVDYQQQQQSQTQAKYQVIVGLYSELQSLQMRLQQAYSSLYTGGGYGYGLGSAIGGSLQFGGVLGGVSGGALIAPPSGTIPGAIPPPPATIGR